MIKGNGIDPAQYSGNPCIVSEKNILLFQWLCRKQPVIFRYSNQSHYGVYEPQLRCINATL